MTNPSASYVYRVRGTLVWAPTNLSTAYPYGGTVLGATRSHYWQPGVQTYSTEESALGVKSATIVEAEYAVFGCVLRSFDADVVNVVFPNTTTYGGGARRHARRNASDDSQYRAGRNLAARGEHLLFVPEDKTTHPALLMYVAVPVLDSEARLELSALDDWGLPVMFECFAMGGAMLIGGETATGKVWQWGKLSDMSVTQTSP